MSTTFCLYDKNVNTELAESNRELHAATNRLFMAVSHATHVFMNKRDIATRMTNNITNPEKMFRLAIGMRLPLVASGTKFTYGNSSIEHKLYTADSIQEALPMIEKAIIVWDNIAYQEKIDFCSPVVIDAGGVLLSGEPLSFASAVNIVRTARQAKKMYGNLW